jgi:shikimate dehydrogenase
VSAISGTTTLVGILGHPVAHSLSPRMQNVAFAAAGLDWAYVPLPVAPERVGDAVRGLVALGFAGANVTIPHKGAVIEHCDVLDPVAAAAGSVNTLVIRDGRVHGSSTDIVALQGAADAGGRRVLVLGRGGAAQAAVAAYDAQGASAVETISRRDVGWPPDASGFDIVVNCTPVKDDPLVRLEERHVVIDMAYNTDRSPTALAAAGREAGCVVVDGLRLLLDQGAASFTLWTGLPAPVIEMAAALAG